jgi:hypothetical protein
MIPKGSSVTPVPLAHPLYSFDSPVVNGLGSSFQLQRRDRITTVHTIGTLGANLHLFQDHNANSADADVSVTDFLFAEIRIQIHLTVIIRKDGFIPRDTRFFRMAIDIPIGA